MAESFGDVFKRAIKTTSGIETVNEELQKFLSIYRITPNASLGMAPAELLFARKIPLVFDKLRPTEKKMEERKITMVNIVSKEKKNGEKIYFKNYKFGKATWEEGTIDKRIGKMWYLIKDIRWM